MRGRTNAVSGMVLPELSNPAGAAQILSGYQAIGADGNVITGNIPSQGAQTITPGTTSKTIAAGRYLSGAQTIAGDANLVPGNIRQGASIFGVSGTYDGAKYYSANNTGYALGSQAGAQYVRFTLPEDADQILALTGKATDNYYSDVWLLYPGFDFRRGEPSRDDAVVIGEQVGGAYASMDVQVSGKEVTIIESADKQSTGESNIEQTRDWNWQCIYTRK